MSTEKYKKPQTIEELKAFCLSKGMPLEQMRFFIGEDYRGARAFGIYKDDDGEFVVYKNKSDGSRAVRYKGPDEAIAVNELYEKLKTETETRRQRSRAASGVRQTVGAGSSEAAAQEQRSGGSSGRSILRFAVPLIIAYFVITTIFSMIGSIGSVSRPHRGYYTIHRSGVHSLGSPVSYEYYDPVYYFVDNDWYYYDYDEDDWQYAEEVPEELQQDYEKYYLSDYYNDDYDFSDFKDSDFYVDYLESYYDDEDDYDWDDDDYDYGSGWDYDDWDSGDTDWDSDW